MTLFWDFTSWMLVGAVLTGMVAALDKWYLAGRRMPGEARAQWIEWSVGLFPVLLVVFFLRAFVAEAYRIPSGSMKPSLTEGDFVLVNKFKYGVRFPLTGQLLIKQSLPERGDVLVFRATEQSGTNYIKRVIGMPGETIEYRNKTYYINGTAVSRQFTENAFQRIPNGISIPVQRFNETLGDLVHPIYLANQPDKPIGPVTVPEGHYFVSGDNRDFSRDSREWGFVPEHHLIGKAQFIIMSWDQVHKDIRWARLGQSIYPTNSQSE